MEFFARVEESLAICISCTGKCTRVSLQRMLEELELAHQGARGVKEHVATKTHQRMAKATEKEPKLA